MPEKLTTTSTAVRPNLFRAADAYFVVINRELIEYDLHLSGVDFVISCITYHLSRKVWTVYVALCARNICL